MSAQPPLLTLRQGSEGPFLRWLEELGLGDFLRRYPPQKLVEWGWLEPQFRYVFPRQYFDNYPTPGRGPVPDFDTEDLLWDSTWFINSEEDDLWFLHPFFHPNDNAGETLRKNGTPATEIPIPQPFDHPEEGEVYPYADYFFHWQGYALIDVIRHSDCFYPVFNTPNALKQVELLTRFVEHASEWDPKKILTTERRWGGFSKPMTWLSHYRSFVRAATPLGGSRSEMFARRRRGAKALAAHLGITAEAVGSGIKNHLLVLAEDWRDANRRATSGWTKKPFEQLRLDILNAVDWLSYLSDRTTEHYLNEWRHEHLGNSEWAELKEILPFEWFEDRESFLDLSPHYLKTFNSVVNEGERLVEAALVRRLDDIRASNAPFGSFLGAFRSIHDQLVTRHPKETVFDFRDLRPLDGYLLLAIRVEAILRYALEDAGDLTLLRPRDHKLSRFISLLASRRGLSHEALSAFDKAVPMVAGLHDTPPEGPIKPIIALETGLSPREDYLVKSFLCSLVARNYFAHHYYFDANLWRSKESGYLLSGILSTVLWLTPGNAARSG